VQFVPSVGKRNSANFPNMMPGPSRFLPLSFH
jgi:hypothetical protein